MEDAGAETSELGFSLVIRCPCAAQPVEDLCSVHARDGRPGPLQVLKDLGGGRLVQQDGQQRIGVEEHRWAVFQRRSSRSSARIWAVDGILPRQAPRSDLAEPRGRTITWSPRSMTTTDATCHRCRISAGIDTCPLDEI